MSLHRAPAACPQPHPAPGSRAEGRDVYAYFDNDIKSAAPFDAEALKQLVR